MLRPAGAAGPSPRSLWLPTAALGRWRTPSLTLEPEIVSGFMLFLPTECMPVSLPCQGFLSTQKAVNYKSCFSPVSSSQPGTSPSFSFVNEAKTQLFTQLCLAARSSFPARPLSLRSPDCAFHSTLLVVCGKSAFSHLRFCHSGETVFGNKDGEGRSSLE